ncbi:MAG: HMA2 domain-containing protein [Treponema sp.]
MIVTSFFPGRIRLRAAVFKNVHLYEKALAIIKKIDDEGAVTSVTHNPVTGSVLIEYDPEKLSVERLSLFKEFALKLNYEAEHYSPERQGAVESLLDEIEKMV